MKLAKSNTDKNLETCGILAGSLVSVLYIFCLKVISKNRYKMSCQVGMLILIYASIVEFSFHVNFFGSVHYLLKLETKVNPLLELLQQKKYFNIPAHVHSYRIYRSCIFLCMSLLCVWCFYVVGFKFFTNVFYPWIYFS